MKLQIVDTVKNLKKDARAARIVELVINCVVLAIFAAVVIRPVVIDILEARDQQEELSNMAGQLSSKA